MLPALCFLLDCQGGNFSQKTTGAAEFTNASEDPRFDPRLDPPTAQVFPLAQLHVTPMGTVK